jgi:hypothetical protein
MKEVPMRQLGAMALALAVAVACAVAQSAPGEPKKVATPNRLVGTWELVSARYGGQEFKFPEGTTMLKHVTPSHFMWATYDKDGKVSRAAGGPYTVTRDKYEETPTYGVGADFDAIKGKAHSFKWKVEGTKWYHDGQLNNGLTIEEVWQRVGKK